jgi:hypothetical protein
VVDGLGKLASAETSSAHCPLDPGAFLAFQQGNIAKDRAQHVTVFDDARHALDDIEKIGDKGRIVPGHFSDCQVQCVNARPTFTQIGECRLCALKRLGNRFDLGSGLQLGKCGFKSSHLLIGQRSLVIDCVGERLSTRSDEPGRHAPLFLQLVHKIGDVWRKFRHALHGRRCRNVVAFVDQFGGPKRHEGEQRDQTQNQNSYIDRHI